MPKFIVPDHVLKALGDSHTLNTTHKIKRQDIKRKILGLLGLNKKTVAPTQIKPVERYTYTCDNTTNLPGRLLVHDDEYVVPQGTNKDADDAHTNAALVDKFYQELFSRCSYDNKGSSLISSVNYDKDYNNAYWNGQQMAYGDGDGKLFANFSNDLTVDAHEITHGHTQNICNLVYFFQSGALNEAISDIFGVTCRHWAEKQSDPKTANWLVGDKCVAKDFPGKSIRTFIPDQLAFKGDPQPSHMSKFVWTLQDNGGVHINSKICNVVFYRMCQYMNLPSYDKPIQIVFRAWFKLKSVSGFRSWGSCLTQAATELYGNGPELEAVKKALADTGL